jgi:hypothetical protein
MEDVTWQSRSKEALMWRVSNRESTKQPGFKMDVNSPGMKHKAHAWGGHDENP